MKLTVADAASGDYREITDKTEIETVLMDVNKCKFQEVNATPFMQKPLRSVVGMRGTTEAAEHFLLGTYEPPNTISDSTKIFLEELKMPASAMQSPQLIQQYQWRNTPGSGIKHEDQHNRH